MVSTIAGRTLLRPLAALALFAFAPSGPVYADISHTVVNTVQSGTDPLPEETAVAEAVVARSTAAGHGQASYYGRELAGNRTASGERFDPQGLTAAHRSLPLGSRVRIINQANGKSVVVRVNDRGPFTHARIMDISYGAAQQLSMLRQVRAGTVDTSVLPSRNWESALQPVMFRALPLRIIWICCAAA